MSNILKKIRCLIFKDCHSLKKLSKIIKIIPEYFLFKAQCTNCGKLFIVHDGLYGKNIIDFDLDHFNKLIDGEKEIKRMDIEEEEDNRNHQWFMEALRLYGVEAFKMKDDRKNQEDQRLKDRLIAADFYFDT